MFSLAIELKEDVNMCLTKIVLWFVLAKKTSSMIAKTITRGAT